MKYRSLGRTGVQVSELCVGTMNFGDDADEQLSIKIVNAAIEAGINFFDSANIYMAGESERILGAALSQSNNRDKVFVATKGHGLMDPHDPNSWGNHRHNLVRACEDSLRRLKTDHIDLYQLHRPQPSIPIDETLRALDSLIQHGKVRYIGTSNFSGWQMVESIWASKELNLPRFVAEQPPYNLLDRRIERDLIPACQTYGVAVLPWAPIAGGILSGKYKIGQVRPEDSRYKAGATANRDNDTALAAVDKFVAFCGDRNVIPAQFALAWCLNQPGVTSPIVGPRTLDQLQAYIESTRLDVTDSDRATIDTIFKPGTHVSEYYNTNSGPTARWI